MSWLVKAIWVDYSLAVALTVVLPLALLIWAFAVGLRPLIQLLIVYWRVSSLLAVTVYLMNRRSAHQFLERGDGAAVDPNGSVVLAGLEHCP
ncbi:DUF3177 family protein [Synechococcus sp. W60.2]|uniref:DUF3177 family protein n=1 Tax=Synechococcus sp. W60.2 TaxID=2964521 RepID=UPI0039C27189